MECAKKGSDSEDDSELEALRLAALATLKSRNKPETVSSESNVKCEASPATPLQASPATPLQALPSTTHQRKEQAHGSLPKNQYSWRNSANQLRRGRGRGTFPKISQRSNLIVITPVSTDDKDSAEKSSVPQLSLPQHKYCQSVNEDSSSPKTYSRRGPTRFNRHESGSESSDSDYDDQSDHDSYSNETILQDENSTNFAQITPEESNEGETPLAAQRISDRRLSFQNPSLDNFQPNEVVGVHNFKSTYPSSSTEDKTMVLSSQIIDSRNQASTNYSSYRQYDPSPSTSYKSQMLSCITVNGVSQGNQDYDRTCRRQSNPTQDAFSSNGANVGKETEDPKLLQNDLRLELKKRMLRLRSENADLTKSENQSLDKQMSGDVRQGCVRDYNRTYNHSRSYGTNDGHVRNRSRSLNRNRNRMHSPSPRNPDRDRNHKRVERNPRRDFSRSPVRRRNRDSSRSPDRNGKRSWSRSPVKKHRPISDSPDRSRKRTLAAQSPERNNKSSHSPYKNRKRSVTPELIPKQEGSHSPRKSRKRSTTRSPVRHPKQDVRSPCKGRKRSTTRSPVRNPKPEDSRSPRKSRKRSVTRSPVRQPKEDDIRSPYRSRKRSTTQSPVQNPKQKDIPSPPKSPVQNPKQDDICKSRKVSVTQGQERNHKRNNSPSPDKNRRRASPHSPHRKHVSRSPVRNRKRNTSPGSETMQSKRDRSRSPIHDSSESPGRNKGRTRNKNSRYRWSHSSRSSSTLSSSSSSSGSSSSSPCVRSISSVIKPVQSSAPSVKASVSSIEKRNSSSGSDLSSSVKRGKDLDEKPKAIASLVKSSIVVGENRNNAPETGKRLPVHMRLGTLPRNKLIRMTKDVEAAFVNSSSEEERDLCAEGKKQNFRVVAEMHANKSDVLTRRVEKSPSKNSSISPSKLRRKKTFR